MASSEAYLDEIFCHLARKGQEEVGRERWARAMETATPDADARRILEACRMFVYDCFEPPLDRPDLALAVLAGTAPAFVPFQLPPDLRKLRRRQAGPRVSSIRLRLGYRACVDRAQPIFTGPRRARQAANLRLTLRTEFQEIPAAALLAPPVPTTPSEVALRVVAWRYGLKDLTVKRRVASIPSTTDELLASERLAFAFPLDLDVLGALRLRLKITLTHEMLAIAAATDDVSSRTSL